MKPEVYQRFYEWINYYFVVVNEREQIDHVLTLLNQEQDVFKKADLRQQLIFLVKYYFFHDPGKVVHLLSVAGMDEQKLKGYLAEHPEENAAELVADMLIGVRKHKPSGTPGHE